MVRKLIRASLCAALGVFTIAFSYGVANSAPNAADPDVSTIMQKSFGKGGFKMTLPAAVKGAKWEDAQKMAKEWNEHAKDLAKATPPKGAAKSWEALTKKFGDNTAAILKATEAKDAKAFTKAMSFNCKECHDKHK